MPPNNITGTKGVARAMTKICQGPAYKEGTTWFQELYFRYYYYSNSYYISTLGKSTRTHLYGAMKNSDGSGVDLQRRIINIIQHYKVISTLIIFTCKSNV